MWKYVVVAAALCLHGTVAETAGDMERRWAGPGGEGALLYAAEGAALLNEAARRDQEVGWRVAATLAVRALACAPDEALLRLEVRSPELQLRGAARHAEWAARPSSWDAPAQRRSAFLLHWRAGRVLALFLPAHEPPAHAGFKRALASLFQFQETEGERNETDVSGACSVLYERGEGGELRKYKRACEWAGAGEEGEGLVESRRVTRIELRTGGEGGGLRAAAADELHEARAAHAGDADAAVKVRSWARVALSGWEPAPRCQPAAPGLEPALHDLTAGLARAALSLPPQVAGDDEQEGEGEGRPEDEEGGPLTVEQALEQAAGGDGERAGRGGDERAARLSLRVYPALRAAPAHTLASGLAGLRDTAALTGAARALGTAGTAAAVEACVAVLQPRGEPLGPAGAAFLAGAGLAPEPQPAFVRALLALAADVKCGRLRAAALLAAGGAAARAGSAVAREVRDDLARQLARCVDAASREPLLAALGNLRGAGSGAAEPLLAAAERGPAAVSRAALRALRAAPGAAPARLLALALDAARPLDVRAAALDLAVVRSAETPLALVEGARRLAAARGAGEGELRRLLWQRLAALAPGRPAVGDLLRAAALDPQLGSWHARAHPGTSSVLTRDAGWGAGGWRAELDSVQLAAGGVLRRGVVALALTGPAGDTHPVLGVELWTRGLAALTGGEEQPAEEGRAEEGRAEDEDEQGAAGGLVLAVAGVQLPPITLFSSQAELLGLVWAGTGSEPGAVLRALLPGRPRRAVRALAAGVATRLTATAAGAAALDAAASVSLWSRTAAARLWLRVAAAGAAHASLSAPWGRAAVRVSASAPAGLHVAADADFYSRVSVCVRARTADHAYSRGAALRSTAGARRWAVRRRRAWRLPRAGRSLALGRLNDAACRALQPHDDPLDDAQL